MRRRFDDDRRIHPRFSRSVAIEGSPAAGGSSARLVASNLSLGGVYCTSDRDIPEMTRLAVRLDLPEEPLEVPAVVVRRKRLATAAESYELALLFTALTAVERERLARYLAQP